MEKKTMQKGKSYYKKGKVLWVLKYKEKLFSKVLGTYPYYVEVDLEKNSSRCTCPQGKDCKHAAATIIVFEEGFYIESHEPVSEFFPEAALKRYLFHENPELGLEIILKELQYQINNDESGSEVARLLREALKLFSLTPSKEKGFQILEIFKEFERLFPDYNLTGELGREVKETLEGCSL
ncbi:SWIM zinc finger family protein [Thermococcus alcaliphilus]|uniref:SWIM zinc finger family protein n=1 Tax=Thermococcus alcaliphilus TaxID=139207 RepID=UPI002090284C|nr:SWIM zinc finger family protein [Thermococcus alcaliphilus]MCO6042008.1 SWIM zinc finger family protein [Thermococcus alcaliphilus]